MRAISFIATNVIAILLFGACVAIGNAGAEDAVRLPVPATALYPGDIIKDELIMERAFAPNLPGVAAFVNDKPSLVGRIVKRTLFPGQLIPINALEEQKVVTRGNVVKVLIEDGDLSIVTYGSSLQSGIPGALIQLRNLDTGVTIRGIVQPDGTVRIQNG